MGLILLGVYGWQWKFSWKDLVHLRNEVAHVVEVRRDRVQETPIYHWQYLFKSVSNAEKGEYVYIETRLPLPRCPLTLQCPVYEILTVFHRKKELTNVLD